MTVMEKGIAKKGRLTYMSIREMITVWERDGDLILWPRQLLSDTSVRWIFCSKEVWSALFGSPESSAHNSNMGRARATLDAFATGMLINVRLPPSKNVRASLALLESADEEVWEFRCRDPNPQMRIFGRFAEKDVFVALLSRKKPEVVTDNDYICAKEECKKQWRVFFPSYKPHTGAQPNDYVSNCVVLN